ncbi:Uncharacterised protein [Shigella sonnei]|nr:Uncharacterised protein [Shigella sonnei]CSK38218.1 Uncharacterised protein [Shigella sonnei]CSK63996.1 Uncharacterised protein [Shigella sonnei]CSN62081.1 Uncharacterised protein [Shigella sonnei]CTC70274.1 Uncharacterised protein [Shigella sonnei]
MADIPEHFLLYGVNSVFHPGNDRLLPESGDHIKCGELKRGYFTRIAGAQAGQIILDGTKVFFSFHHSDMNLSCFICINNHVFQNVIRWLVCRCQHKISLRAAVPGNDFFVIKGRGNNLFRQPAVNGGTESGL